MQTAVRPITCGICGAKYKIPSTFAGTGVTCRRCDHRISLVSQETPGTGKKRRTTSGRRTITMRKRTGKATRMQIVSGVAILGVLAVALVFLL